MTIYDALGRPRHGKDTPDNTYFYVSHGRRVNINDGETMSVLWAPYLVGERLPLADATLGNPLGTVEPKVEDLLEKL